MTLSPLSNTSAFQFLVGLQKELGVRFLPVNLKKLLSKLLNRYMKNIEVEAVKFKVSNT